jgi:spore coat polysaccharide biosynthesis predicted glycosyltransferase SpsG
LTKLNILFRTAGGSAKQKKLGFGHINRCISLAENLKKCRISFLIEDYGGGEDFIRKKGFNDISKLNKSENLIKEFKTIEKSILKNNIDVLIFDKYKPNKNYIRKLKKIVRIVVITDLYDFDYSADLVINGFIGLQNKKIRNKNRSFCLLGPSYQILNKKFNENRIKNNPKFDILLTFGGFDEKNILNEILFYLKKYQSKFKIRVILGPGIKKMKNINKYEEFFGNNLSIVDKTLDMKKEIENSRFGICSGGITTYEFASSNTPFAIVCQEKHQLKTAEEWEKQKIAVNLGLIGRNSKKIKKFIIQIIDDDLSSFKIKKNFIDGKGTSKVALEILKLKSLNFK